MEQGPHPRQPGMPTKGCSRRNKNQERPNRAGPNTGGRGRPAFGSMPVWPNAFSALLVVKDVFEKRNHSGEQL